jgi:hypothetical protein
MRRRAAPVSLPHLVHSLGEQFAYFRFRVTRIDSGRCTVLARRGTSRCMVCDLAWDALRSGMREASP